MFSTYIYKGQSWRDEQIFKVYFEYQLIKRCDSELEAIELCNKLNKVLAGV